MRVFIFFWCVAGFLEIPFLSIFAGGPSYFLDSHPLLSLGFHLLACTILFFSSSTGTGWLLRERLWPLTFFLLTFFLPPFGWLGSGILFFCYRFNPPGTVFQKEEGDFLPAAALGGMIAAGKLPKQTRILQELDFIPLTDILAGENLDLKRGAIDRLAQLKTPEAIDALLARRSDSSMDVRFYATSALARIKKEFDEQLEAAKKQMKKDVYKVSARVFLAKVYLQYARSHLLDESTALTFEREALHHLEFSVKSENAVKEAFQMLIEIYVSHQEWAKALSVLHLYEKSPKADAMEIAKWKTDIFFRTHRYGDVVRELALMRKEGVMDAQWEVLAGWWGVA